MFVTVKERLGEGVPPHFDLPLPFSILTIIVAVLDTYAIPQ